MKVAMMQVEKKDTLMQIHNNKITVTHQLYF